MIGLPEYSHPNDIWFDTRFPQSRSTLSSQQAIIHFNEVPQWVSSRHRQYQPTYFEGGNNRSHCEMGYVSSNQVGPLK